MAWNLGYTVAEAATAFVLAPVLVRQLGDRVYGLWLLLGSVAIYLGLLDFGIRGSVGRYVAFHRAQGDPNAVTAVFRSGLVMSTAAGVMVLILGFGLERAFVKVFDIPPEVGPEIKGRARSQRDEVDPVLA